MQKMQEAAPRQGERWEAFRDRRLADRDQIEVLMLSAQPWEKEELRSQLSQIWYDLNVADSYLKEPGDTW